MDAETICEKFYSSELGNDPLPVDALDISSLNTGEKEVVKEGARKLSLSRGEDDTGGGCVLSYVCFSLRGFFFVVLFFQFFFVVVVVVVVVVCVRVWEDGGGERGDEEASGRMMHAGLFL